MNKLQNISILGVRIDVVDIAAALEVIQEFIQDGEPHMVVTADSSGIVLAQRDLELKKIINAADLVTPDSIGILWAAKRFGTPLLERVSGADLVMHLCERAARSGHRVFLLGAAPGVVDAAAETLKQRYPGLKIVGTHHGYFEPEESESIAQMVRDVTPDILFVAMGIPLQEKWIFRHLQEMQVPVSMGVGGTFDVIAGRVKRAPKWMQRKGLEWVYRLASNPRKIGKCSSLPVFVLKVLFGKDT